ncbi:hypothetical protein [Thalassotalea atypica]|uniref:hypothetical protein n=1 Tax=Thalassotalea atypica TaxID=2054316 RepID=UPI0025736475|nr:hypothetical protein [Thalassotalea atypica]
MKALINDIQLLNANCKKAFAEERFKQGNELLAQRQLKVKSLVKQLEMIDRECAKAQSAFLFLRQLLEDDKVQAIHFSNLKNESLQQNIKQKKITNAVNKYQKINLL